MGSSVRIVGQGLAGCLLAWELEKNGVAFAFEDAPPAPSASMVGAGIINPVTGQRWVKSWRVDALLPNALQTYSELEYETGRRFVHPMRVRRLFRSEEERELVQRKFVGGELAPYLVSLDPDGAWIEPAYRVDTGAITTALRERWKDRNLARRDARALNALTGPEEEVTIRCQGAAELGFAESHFARLGIARGDILTLRVKGLDERTIINAGHWALPLGRDVVRVGATYDRAVSDCTPNLLNREALLAWSRQFLSAEADLIRHDVGVRVTTPDRHPIVGWLAQGTRTGVINGLGSKGALLAPELARQWVRHLREGAVFDPELDVRRFA